MQARLCQESSSASTCQVTAPIRCHSGCLQSAQRKSCNSGCLSSPVQLYLQAWASSPPLLILGFYKQPGAKIPDVLVVTSGEASTCAASGVSTITEDAVCSVGGPVWCLDWCPRPEPRGTPASDSTYLAVCTVLVSNGECAPVYHCMTGGVHLRLARTQRTGSRTWLGERWRGWCCCRSGRSEALQGRRQGRQQAAPARLQRRPPPDWHRPSASTAASFGTANGSLAAGAGTGAPPSRPMCMSAARNGKSPLRQALLSGAFYHHPS